MSHIVEIEMEVKDLQALRKACEVMGDVEFVENQKTYRCWGTGKPLSQITQTQSYNPDNPMMPLGFTLAEMGQCQHAIRIRSDSAAYEVGIVRRRDGKPGYVLLQDFWNADRSGEPSALQRVIGPNGERLINHYGAQVAVSRMRHKGFRVDVTEDRATHNVRAVCRR